MEVFPQKKTVSFERCVFLASSHALHSSEVTSCVGTREPAVMQGSLDWNGTGMETIHLNLK